MWEFVVEAEGRGLRVRVERRRSLRAERKSESASNDASRAKESKGLTVRPVL